MIMNVGTCKKTKTTVKPCYFGQRKISKISKVFETVVKKIRKWWLGFSNHFGKPMVFEIHEFEIPKLNQNIK